MQPDSPAPAPPQPPVQYTYPQQQPESPGQTLGIIGIVVNVVGFFFPLLFVVGIVMGILSRNQSKQYGMPTTLGTISLVWGITGISLTILMVIFWLLFIIFFATAASIAS